MNILLEDYDSNRLAIIEPKMVAPPLDGFPKTAITCFSKRLLDKALEGREKEEICVLETEDGGIPVYRITYKEREFALYMSRVGAPACVVQMEEMISRGADAFVMFGSCGVLDNSLGKWHTIIPTAAMRDEGVSYHYLPASPEVEAQPDCVKILEDVFLQWGEAFVCGKVWTIDAIYRETRAKAEKRREQGCIAVDMEAAAVQAVAKFRGVKLAQFFYAEDNLDNPVWDDRGLSYQIHTEADRLFQAALECGLRL